MNFVREVGHGGELDHLPGSWGWPLLGDLPSQLCVAEEGAARLSASEIVDHMIFMLLAAHDTLASTLTSCVYAPCRPT